MSWVGGEGGVFLQLSVLVADLRNEQIFMHTTAVSTACEIWRINIVKKFQHSSQLLDRIEWFCKKAKSLENRAIMAGSWHGRYLFINVYG